jgi:hypothetical protein
VTVKMVVVNFTNFCGETSCSRTHVVFQNTRPHILDDVLYFYFQAQIIAKNHINVIKRVRKRNKKSEVVPDGP